MNQVEWNDDVLLVPAQFPRIQAAVDAVERPSTIVVYPGVYSESILVKDTPEIVIQSARLSRRGVTLTGQEPHGVLIIERSTVHLSGIEIRSKEQRRGIWVSDSTVSLQDCVIAGNRTLCTDPDGSDTSGEQSLEPNWRSAAVANGAAMYCVRSSVRVQKSSVIGNTVDCSISSQGQDARGGAFYFEDCKVEIAGSTIQANAIYSLEAARGGGIWCERCRLRMWRSRVTDNALYAPMCEGAGIYFRDALAAELGGSVISGNGSVEGKGGGIYIEGDETKVKMHRNTVVHLNHPDDLYTRAQCNKGF